MRSLLPNRKPSKHASRKLNLIESILLAAEQPIGTEYRIPQASRCDRAWGSFVQALDNYMVGRFPEACSDAEVAMVAGPVAGFAGLKEHARILRDAGVLAMGNPAKRGWSTSTRPCARLRTISVAQESITWNSAWMETWSAA